MKVFFIKSLATFYRANSKKDLQEYFDLKPSDIVVQEQDEPLAIDFPKMVLKNRTIEDAIYHSQWTRTPTRIFEIGEPVAVGNLNSFFVKEIFEDGKVILIENEAGDYKISQWQDLQKQQGTKEVFKKNTLDIHFLNGQIGSLLIKYYYFGVDMEPFYQRELVWTQEQKELLIDSIFKKIDIGKFVFVSMPYADKACSYQILDGKQRLSTLLDYYEDKFSCNGVFYSELTKLEKHYFDNSGVLIAEIQERNLNEKLIVEYFINLNVTGTPVDRKFLNELADKYLA